ncbi:MAG: hypothetical protein NZ576_04025, partial [Bacteroidia bacterium]|nr:hypothetical protein [Bacteroidia bacterium]
MPPNSTDAHSCPCVTPPSPSVMLYVCSHHVINAHKIFASTYWLPHPALSIAIPPPHERHYKAN